MQVDGVEEGHITLIGRQQTSSLINGNVGGGYVIENIVLVKRELWEDHDGVGTCQLLETIHLGDIRGNV